jgi:hypothetical protein
MAFVLVVLLGFAGLAIDGSNIYYQSQRMQISADAAALGGARKLANGDSSALDAEIRSLATANGADADKVSWNYINDNRGAQLVAARACPAYFARIYGHNVFTATAESEAQYETVAGASGIFPFTIGCNCMGDDGLTHSDDDDGSGGGGDGGSGGDSSATPTATAVPINTSVPTSGTVELVDNQTSSYGISYVGQNGNTWVYEVNEIDGNDLSSWLLNIDSCLNQVVSFTPSSGASIGTDASTGLSGIKWDVASSFTSGTFSFTLNDTYPSGEVDVLAKSNTVFGTVGIVGPICDGTNTGNGGGTGVAGLSLPTLDFETDTAGAALVAGQIIDTEWAAWGVHVTTSSASSHPAMIFNTASPTGGDSDLGTANQAFGGPGVGAGGGGSMPGSNSVPLSKVLIVAETTNSANPDDSANGGTIIFTFDYAVRVDDVGILDIDDSSAAGTIKAYSDANGATLIATGKMLGLGDNSVQTVGVNASSVRRLEITFPASGAMASLVSCRTGSQSTYSIGNLIWSDTNNYGIQDSGEAGIAGVAMELYVSGQNNVVAKTTTNAGGEYLFSGLPAGSYEVKVAASNFNTGQVLAGATYSAANSGSNDNVDSDFSSSTGRAPAIITNVDNLTVDGGFRLSTGTSTDTGSQSAIITVNDNKKSQYEVSLVSVTGNTWQYRVREMAKQNSVHNMTQWNLGIGTCLANIQTPTSPSGTVNSSGITWNVANDFTDGYFSFTLNGSYAAQSVQAYIGTSQGSGSVTISGPNCTTAATPTLTPTPTTASTAVATATPTPTMTATPTPVSSPTPVPTSAGNAEQGEPCTCESPNAGFEYGVEYTLHEPVKNAPGNFGWLRWVENGDQASATDLQRNIEHPENSPVLEIGDWVVGTTGNTNSSGVEIALESWVGKQVTIPIFDEVTGTGSNAQYRICTFAVFVLNDWDKQSKTMKGTFVRTILPSELTDNSVPDFGARDVRFRQ